LQQISKNISMWWLNNANTTNMSFVTNVTVNNNAQAASAAAAGLGNLSLDENKSDNSAVELGTFLCDTYDVSCIEPDLSAPAGKTYVGKTLIQLRNDGTCNMISDGQDGSPLGYFPPFSNQEGQWTQHASSKVITVSAINFAYPNLAMATIPSAFDNKRHTVRNTYIIKITGDDLKANLRVDKFDSQAFPAHAPEGDFCVLKDYENESHLSGFSFSQYLFGHRVKAYKPASMASHECPEE
jgi:hypothetical protein